MLLSWFYKVVLYIYIPTRVYIKKNKKKKERKNEMKDERTRYGKCPIGLQAGALSI